MAPFWLKLKLPRLVYPKPPSSNKALRIIHFNFGVDKNKGDAAIIFGIQDLLRKHLGSDIQINSINISYLSHREYLSICQSIFNWVQQKNQPIWLNLVKILLWPAKVLAKIRDWQILWYANQHDLIIIGGGGVYSTAYLLPLKDNLIKQFKPSVIVFAAGYNQGLKDRALTDADKQSIRILYNKSRLTSVRDQRTYQFLQEIDSKFQPIVIPDPAIVLQSKPITGLDFPKHKLKIGINLACHQSWLVEAAQKYQLVETYANLINQLHQSLDIEVYYLVHTNYTYRHKGTNYSELQLAQELQTKLVKTMTFCDYPARELKYVYENLDVVVCMMLHSSILAFASTVPFVVIGYDKKNLAFTDLINYSEYHIHLTKLTTTDLSTKFFQLLKQKDQIKQYFQLQKTQFLEQLDEFTLQIKQLLKKSGMI